MHSRLYPVIVILLAALTAIPSAPAQSEVRPEKPGLESLPSAWYQFTIDWKPTWNETFATNKDFCTPRAIKDAELQPIVNNIAEYRLIWLLESMLAHFPQEGTNRMQAYVDIANAWQRTGQQYWRSAWGVRLLESFQGDGNAVEQGYQLALGWAFGQYVHWGTYVYGVFPECRDFAYLIQDILAKNRAGRLPDEHPAVATACSYQSWLLTDLLRYDEIHPFLDMLRAKGARMPAYLQEANDLLARFGHVPEKNEGVVAKPEANDELGTATIVDDDGVVRDVRPDLELRTRWDVLTKFGPLAPGSSEPLVPRDIQKVLDLIVKSPGHLKGGNRYAPFWGIVDRRLRELPPDRLQLLRDAQESAGKSSLQTATITGDKRLVLRAFSQYPFSASVHRAMIEAAEGDIFTGRFQWAVMAYEDVLAHTADPQVASAARAGLWLILSQSNLYRKRLEKAMAGVPDDAVMPWRGATIAAGQLKRELLVEAPADPGPASAPGPTTLVQLPRRRIVLPPEWPARQFDLGGPHMAWGVRTPWPATRVEIGSGFTLVGCARDVARFNAGSDKPLWGCAPPDYSTWVWSPATPRSYACVPTPYHVFQLQRSPVAVSAVTGRSDIRFYLMQTSIPPVIAAVDIRTGRVLWTTQGKAGWEGLTPLTHPAAAEGYVYVLAGPVNVERLAELGFNDSVKVVQELMCLDSSDGEMVWRRPMGWVPNSSIDLARGAGAVAFSDGSVYSATSMGILARHDASDGTPEWVATYRPARQYSNVQSINCIREGSTPLVLPDRVILAPRDHTGVLAFRRDRGELIWETVLVPSDRLVGVAGSVVIGANSQWLTGLDLATGKQLWVREFPRGIGSQAGILSDGTVVVVSAGTAYRLAPATGKNVEELDLKASPGAEFVVGPEGTLVEVAPAPMAPDKGPATAGLPLQLPLRKVWSFACDDPILVVREGSGARTETIGVLSGRRIGMLRTSPRWEMAWQRGVPERPQAFALAGDRLLTAHRWTMTSYDVAGGNEQWAMQLPLIPARIGGDDKLVYALPNGGNGGSSYFAAVDPERQTVLWKYALQWDPRFGNSAFATQFLRRPDGGADLLTVDHIAGRGIGEVVQDAQTGKVRSFRVISPPGLWYWVEYKYGEQGVGWIGSDHKIYAVGPSGEESLTAGWPRTVDFKYQRVFVDVRADGIYLRKASHLLRFDPATKGETDYDLSPGEELLTRVVLEFRRMDDKLIVISGDIGAGIHADVFEYATAKRLGHQVLPDVRCRIGRRDRNILDGCDTQVIFLDGSIVVTDIDSVNVFACPREQ